MRYRVPRPELDPDPKGLIMAATKHSTDCCEPGRGPGFRRTPGCPRCEELTAGAAPRAAVFTPRNRAAEDAARRADWDAHLKSARHLGDGPGCCGSVCVYMDW